MYIKLSYRNPGRLQTGITTLWMYGDNTRRVQGGAPLYMYGIVGLVKLYNSMNIELFAQQEEHNIMDSTVFKDRCTQAIYVVALKLK